MGALIPDEEKKQSEFAVLEVPLNGKALRIDKIEAAPTGEMGSDFLEAVQIALSPDGTLIAASTGDWNHARPERRGLFLLDVRKPERPVHFYPAPALPAPPK